MRIERFGVWVNEMDVMPSGYGVAWYSPWSCRAFCMRVPFNRIAGKVRAWYLDWRLQCDDDRIMEAYRYGENVGFQRGNNHGYERGMCHAKIAQEHGWR